MQQTEKISIQWYPGHMTRATRMIQENISQVDAVCEVLDARIPRASRNPDIPSLTAGKPSLIILNRADLADPEKTEEWKKYYMSRGAAVLKSDARTGTGVREFAPAVRSLLAERIRTFEEKGQVGRAVRVMILGIPNVGKSTLINKVAGRKAAAAGDKPGVTRGKQWITVDRGLELLDTPGILWPRFESQEVGELLAVTNAIKAEVVDRETLAANFMLRLVRLYPQSVAERYKIRPDESRTGFELLEEAGRKRGFRISGGEIDLERMANTLLTEYHEGRLGRLTLEVPHE